MSEFSADEIATHTAIPRDRIRVVPNGVDLDRATDAAVDDARRAVRRSTTARTCSGRAPSSRARTCGCCSTRSRGSTPDDGAAPARARRAAGLEARRRRRRGRAGARRPGAAARARSTASSCSRCSPAPTCSRSRAGTRGSASPWSRRWRRAPRWCAPTSRRSARSPATRRASSRPDDVDGWVDAFTHAAHRRRRRAIAARGCRYASGSGATRGSAAPRETVAVYREALSG